MYFQALVVILATAGALIASLVFSDPEEHMGERVKVDCPVCAAEAPIPQMGPACPEMGWPFLVPCDSGTFRLFHCDETNFQDDKT